MGFGPSTSDYTILKKCLPTVETRDLIPKIHISQIYNVEKEWEGHDFSTVWRFTNSNSVTLLDNTLNISKDDPVSNERKETKIHLKVNRIK